MRERVPFKTRGPTSAR